MKRLLSVCALAAMLILSGALAAKKASEEAWLAQPLPKAWEKVQQAQKEGKPKTAIERIAPLLEKALEEENYPFAVKAIAYRIKIEGDIEGRKASERIRRMEAELENAPLEMKPLMECLLGHWYWGHFQQNRWRYMQRTAGASGDDIETWDLNRIFKEIDTRYSKALASKDVLREIPVEKWQLILSKGGYTTREGKQDGVLDSYRPTLYDFVAHEALNFYKSGEQNGNLSTDAFELFVDSPVFGTEKEFLAWKIETTDEDSPIAKALRLMQDLMRFHAEDEDRSAYIDVNLMRLQYGYNVAVGPEKTERYTIALDRFIKDYADHRISARAMGAKAQLLYDAGERVEALEMAERGHKVFTNSPGGNHCYNLIQRILSKSSSIKTERVWNAPWPEISVTYRNLSKVHFRVVKMDWEKTVLKKGWSWENLDHHQKENLLKEDPVRSWNNDLPATADYHDRQELIPVPQDLESGFYSLISSHNAAFTGKANVISCTPFWVSDLNLVMRSYRGSGVLEGFVLDAGLGHPVEGAMVQSWFRARRGEKKAGPTVTSDANGLFSIPAPERQNFIVLATHEGQKVSSGQSSASSGWSNAKPSTRTMFFTDRSLYRPGQTIRFKGLCISVNQAQDNYSALGGKAVAVSLRDVNGKEVERLQLKSNAYGSFTGSFTAPADRATGRMSIRVEGEPRGYASVSVEEYKRPKFKVTVDAPEKAVRLGDEVTVEGKAMAYTGASIDGASVAYRVVREVRFPEWWGWYCWWRPPYQGGSQEIAYGKAKTESDGTFKVTFTAKPDLSVDEESEPTFVYTVYADVTDMTGESRSANKSVSVGYTALKASMSAADWQETGKPVEISVMTSSLGGTGKPADVNVIIHKLKAPDRVQRARLRGDNYYWGHYRSAEVKPEPDLSDPKSWDLGSVADKQSLKTLPDGTGSLEVKGLKAGFYRAVLSTKDAYGKEVSAILPLRVVDVKARNCKLMVPGLVAAPKWTLEPGDNFVALWGSGYETARAYIEIEHRGKMLQAFWTDEKRTQEAVEQAIDESMRGGITIHVTQVRENRAYLTSRKVEIPWSNKNLSVKWERMVSKLGPGKKETWTAVVEGPDARTAVAEMVAGMYDKSLDAFKAHNWMQRFNVFRQERTRLNSSFNNRMMHLGHVQGNWPQDNRRVNLNYRHFPNDLTASYVLRERRLAMARSGKGGWPQGLERAEMTMTASAAPMALADSAMKFNAASLDASAPLAEKKSEDSAGGASAPGGAAQGPDLSKVSARKNLQETAFFFPHLVSDQDGKVRMEFTMPEALTEWKFMAFAHDKNLRSGYLEDSAVTSKDLMVQPNPPRFLREADVLEFTVKVSNISPTRQEGTVRLTFSDARTLKPVDSELGIQASDQKFSVPAGESRTFSWRLNVPDRMGYLQYKAVASTGKLSDGEEAYLPVLSRRILVTESLPLPIRKPGTKDFRFEKLLKSAESDSLEHQQLVVQMVSNPSWYAVMALPYLMEYQHQCSEQTFNRLYANALARHIAKSDPKIRRIFDLWKGTDALDSPMEKNQDLKSVMLEETPWLAQGEDESAARKRVGVLFDDNRLDSETAKLMRKLADMQNGDGAWPWFPGGIGSDYITLYITTGYGRLRHLGVQGIDASPAVKSLKRLDGWIDKTYKNLRKLDGFDKDNHYINSTIALYLYGRSFFLEDQAIAPQHKEAVDFYLAQSAKHWLKLPRQSQGHLALAVHRFGKDKETPQAIMASIKEFSKTDEELGMFWRDTEHSWWWYRAPIETQALMIEAFDEVAGDKQSVEDCKVWLLKQKQTQDWKTTKATADAVYALLLRGTDMLASDELVTVSLAGKAIEPENVEAGTGFYEERFTRGEIKPEMGSIQLKKVDEGVAWGSVHWQYFEDMSKVTPYEGTPLKLQKALFTKVNTKKGKVLEPVKGAISVGDELVTRIVLKVDRDMEYVHLKDHRGSGTEPVNVLSSYKYQDGLRYYESTKDTASHFFIDYLPKGTYVFEYSSRVQHRGEYQSGMASVQCMYAPEFNSHSESHTLRVTK